MLELGLLIGVVVLLGKIAEHEDRSPVVWGGLTLLLCIASLFVVPLPFGRMLIAGVAAFVAMTVARATGH
jgi:hypothetical protein